MTKNLFLDTNVWLRLFLQDNPDQFQTVLQLFSKVEQGDFKPYASAIVFLEIHFILKRVYSQTDQEIVSVFNKIKQVRNVTIIEKTNLHQGINFYKEYRIKFPDCLIASQLPKNTILVSFDEELPKIKEIMVKKPQEII